MRETPDLSIVTRAYGGVPVVDDVYTRVLFMTLKYIGIVYV